MTFARLLRHLLRLNESSLAAEFWEGVPPTDWPLPSEAWIAEAQRRSAEYYAGRSSSTPWSEV